MSDGANGASQLRFVSEYLIFGQPIRASMPMHDTLGVTKRRLNTLLGEEEEAIVREVMEKGSMEQDAYGWADADWCAYITDESAQERALPPGMPSSTLDQGHAGLRLNDFVTHPAARAAKLDTAQVLALRLYTCSVYRSINMPLRTGCTLTRPHPFPALVAHLTEGLKQLRSAALQSGDNSVGARVLWRGVRDRGIADEFFERGGTECAPMSTTSDRRVAEEYATRLDAAGNAPATSVLFKIVVDNFLHCGAEISFLSCFPSEAEWLFPPNTYLLPTQHGADAAGAGGDVRRRGVMEKTESGADIEVVEVKPSF